MLNSDATPNVYLFPLCDQRGDLLRALQDASISSGTRVDALMLAWLLDLPYGVRAEQAAAAILTVIESRPLKPRTAEQREMVDALRSHAFGKRMRRSTSTNAYAGEWASIMRPRRRLSATAVARRQRKTRSTRVSQDALLE